MNKATSLTKQISHSKEPQNMSINLSLILDFIQPSKKPIHPCL
jgi:hypothetical protein